MTQAEVTGGSFLSGNDEINKLNMKEDASESLETCTFCLIANGVDEEATILKKNQELVCFKDIYPAAPHHYLVVPTQHLTSCHSLQRRHVNLVERMAEMGKAVLHDQGITDMSDIRLGFHQPPYTSVDHLHLHVLAPARQISQYWAFKFMPKSYRFVTVERVLKHLKQKPTEVSRTAGCWLPGLLKTLDIVQKCAKQ